MKNYFIILFSLVVFTAQSQSIELFYNNELINDTLTISIGGSGTTQHIDIANVSANDIPVMVRRERISMLPNAENEFCFGSCALPSVDELEDPVLVSAGDTLRQGGMTDYFYTSYDSHGDNGTSIIKFTFYNKNSPNDRADVIFKFVTGDVGICNSDHEIVSVFEAFPNPANANTVIKHNFTNQNVNNAQIVLTSLTGAVIETIAVNPSENETTIDTSNLSQGIYFYSLKANGKISVTKKLIVK